MKKDYKEIAKEKGIIGERRFQAFCDELHRLYPDVTFYTNIYIETVSKVSSTEIDILGVSKYGIFCIEHKAWNGEYYVPLDLETPYWTVYRECMNRVFSIPSPYLQNRTHCKAIQKYLNIPECRNIIIVPDSCNLKLSNGRPVFNRSELYKDIMNYSLFGEYISNLHMEKEIYSKEVLDGIKKKIHESLFNSISLVL